MKKKSRPGWAWDWARTGASLISAVAEASDNPHWFWPWLKIGAALVKAASETEDESEETEVEEG